MQKSGGLQYPEDIAAMPICFAINLKPYSILAKSGQSELASADASDMSGNFIYLPMPTSGLIDDFHIEYEKAALGAIGGVASTIRNAISNPGGIIGGIGSGLALYFKGLGQSAAEALGDQVGQGEAAGAAAELTAGFINNPNLAILFKGIKPRTFSFSWKLVAKNPTEADSIQKIITMLKKSSLPAKQFGSNFALNYPNIAYLGLLVSKDGNERSGLSALKYITFSESGSFITDIKVDYSGAGHASFFKDNKPVQVNITLNFQERGIITAEDIV